MTVDPMIYEILGDFQRNFGGFDARTLTPIPIMVDLPGFELLGRLTVYPWTSEVLWTPLSDNLDNVISLTRVNAADQAFGAFYDSTWSGLTCEVRVRHLILSALVPCDLEWHMVSLRSAPGCLDWRCGLICMCTWYPRLLVMWMCGGGGGCLTCHTMILLHSMHPVDLISSSSSLCLAHVLANTRMRVQRDWTSYTCEDASKSSSGFSPSTSGNNCAKLKYCSRLASILSYTDPSIRSWDEVFRLMVHVQRFLYPTQHFQFPRTTFHEFNSTAWIDVEASIANSPVFYDAYVRQCQPQNCQISYVSSVVVVVARV